MFAAFFKTFAVCLLFVFCTGSARSAQSGDLRESSFTIFKKDMGSLAPESIGKAFFREQSLTMEGRTVVYYTVDIQYSNQGRAKKERYESISFAGTLDVIYSRYQDFNRLRITSIKREKALQLSVIRDEAHGYNTSITIPPGVFASTVLYLKLRDMIGNAQKDFRYAVLNEDHYMSHNIIKNGRAVYKGIVSEKDSDKKFYVFANSSGGESSLIYYDMGRQLEKITFLKIGLSILFVRDV